MKLSLMKTSVAGATLVIAASAYAIANEQPPQNAISMDQARATAAAALAGSIEDEELEKEDGTWVYSFEIKGKNDSKTHEVQVDAVSGKLMSTNAESEDDGGEQENESDDVD